MDIGAKMDIGKPEAQGSFAAPTWLDGDHCKHCSTPLVRGVEVRLCAHCADRLLDEIQDIAGYMQTDARTQSGYDKHAANYKADALWRASRILAELLRTRARRETEHLEDAKACGYDNDPTGSTHIAKPSNTKLCGGGAKPEDKQQ